MIHQKHLKDTVDRVAANTLEPITRNSFKKHLFLDLFGASGKN